MKAKQAGSRSDAILPMTDDYMQQIVRREKNYEFRRYRLNASIKRVWFYLNAPHSHIAYVCEIDPAHTREPGDAPLLENGLGNKEFNNRHPDWDRYDFAYRVRSVRRLHAPVPLKQLKGKYGLGGAPRGMVYVPDDLARDIDWESQEEVWADNLAPDPSEDHFVSVIGKRTLRDDETDPLDIKKTRLS